MVASNVTDLVVNQYIRQPVPVNKDGMDTYLSGQLQEIENSMKTIGEGSIQVADAAPARPLKGMVRYAISPWDPLGDSFQGLVVYSGTTWLRASDPEGTVSGLAGDVSANASAITSLSSTVTSQGNSITANASSITSLNTTVGGHTTSISQNLSSINGIEGKYAVKIDNNGHVSGFGLISTANNGTPTSTFNVAADAFKIGYADSGGAAQTTVPFAHYNNSRTVDGVTVPAGTYIENAFITAANIKTLDVDVINLDNVTLDTNASNQLIIKTGGVGTDQIAVNAISSIGYQNFTNSNYTVNHATTLNTKVVEFTFATVAGVAVEFDYNLTFEAYAHSPSIPLSTLGVGDGHEVRCRAAIAYDASIPSLYYNFGPEQRYQATKHNIYFAPLINASGTVILPASLAETHSSAKFAVFISQSVRDSNGNLDTYWDEGRVTGTLKARYIKR